VKGDPGQPEPAVDQGAGIPFRLEQRLGGEQPAS